MRIGLLGTLAVYDEAGQPVRIGGQRVRMLLILLALDAGRVVPTYSLIERLWEDEPPANAGNSLQSLVSRLRSALREAGPGDQVIESHPVGYRLALAPDEVDAVALKRWHGKEARRLPPVMRRRPSERCGKPLMSGGGLRWRMCLARVSRPVLPPGWRSCAPAPRWT